MQINPYLFFNGNCAEAFKYYETVLGGKILAMLTHGESPAAAHVGPENQNSILHAHLVVGDYALMGSDTCSGDFKQPEGISVRSTSRTPRKRSASIMRWRTVGP